MPMRKVADRCSFPNDAMGKHIGLDCYVDAWRISFKSTVRDI